MRAKTFGLGIVCGLLLAVVPTALISQFRSLFLSVPPTRDTESAFFRNYNPRSLIESFSCGNIVMSQEGSHGGSAGVGFTSYQSGISANIEIDDKHWIPLMQALAWDVNKQLLLGGSSRTGAGKDVTSRFYYQDGRSLGTVTIPPPLPTQTNVPTHPGCTPVVVSIYVDEVFVPTLPLNATDQLARITNRLDRSKQ